MALIPASKRQMAITLEELKARIGSKLCLFGSMQLKTLENGSVDEVIRQTRRMMLAGKPGGRFVLMPTPLSTFLYSPKKKKMIVPSSILRWNMPRTDFLSESSQGGSPDSPCLSLFLLTVSIILKTQSSLPRKLGFSTG